MDSLWDATLQPEPKQYTLCVHYTNATHIFMSTLALLWLCCYSAIALCLIEDLACHVCASKRQCCCTHSIASLDTASTAPAEQLDSHHLPNPAYQPALCSGVMHQRWMLMLQVQERCSSLQSLLDAKSQEVVALQTQLQQAEELAEKRWVRNRLHRLLLMHKNQ